MVQRPTARYYVENLHWKSPSDPSLYRSGNLTVEGEEGLQESEGMVDTRRTQPIELSKAHIGSLRIKTQTQEGHGSVPGLLCVCCDCQLVFVGHLTVGAGISLTLLPVLVTLLLFCCFIQHRHENFSLVLLYLDLSCQQLSSFSWKLVLF